MIDLRADLTGSDRVGVARIAKRSCRELITPGALVQAGTTTAWEWVRVEAVVDEEVLFTRVMPSAPRDTFNG